MQTSGCHDYMDPQRDPRGSEIPFLGMNYMKETTRQKVENCSLLMYTIVYVCYDRILMTHLAPSQVTWASCRKPLWWKGSLSLAQDRHGFNSLIALLRIALTISGGRDYYGLFMIILPHEVTQFTLYICMNHKPHKLWTDWDLGSCLKQPRPAPSWNPRSMLQSMRRNCDVISDWGEEFYFCLHYKSLLYDIICMYSDTVWLHPQWHYVYYIILYIY